MIISERQLQLLDKEIETRFYKLLESELVQSHPDYFVEYAIVEFIENLKQKVTQYEINKKEDVRFYANYMVANGQNFDSAEINPDIASVLADESIAPDNKMYRIYCLDIESQLQGS
jgi:hypothetical protein